MPKKFKTAKPDEFKINREWADLMPPITKEDEDRLINDIKDNGIRVPVDVLPDMWLIDGHQRRRIVSQHPELPQKIPYRARDDLKVEEVKEFILKSNLFRRHLSKFRQVQLVVEHAEKEGWFKEAEERMKKGKIADPGDKMSLGYEKTRTRIAKTFGVPEYMVRLYLRLKANKEMDTLVRLLDGAMKPLEAQKKLDDKIKRKDTPPKKSKKDILFIPMVDKATFDIHVDRLKSMLWAPSRGDTAKVVVEFVNLKKEKKEPKEKRWKATPFKGMACPHGVVGGCVQCYRDTSGGRGKKTAVIKQSAVKIPVGKEEMASFRVLPDRGAESCRSCPLFDSMNGLCRIRLGKDTVPDKCKKWRK